MQPASSVLKCAAAALLLITPSACSDFPRDPNKTLEQIETRREIRVGAAASLPPEATKLLSTIERRTHATAHVSTGTLEPLLVSLEGGDLDLVIAPFRKDSALAATASLSPPILVVGRGKQASEWRAAMRNGENRWIMLVETSARSVGASE